MEVRRILPGLSQELSGHGRRRLRRPAGGHRAAGLPGKAGSGRHLALAGIRLAPEGQRLRHLRLPGRRPPVRHYGGHGGAHRPGPGAGHQHHHGPGAQPQLGPAPLVPRGQGGPGEPLS